MARTNGAAESYGVVQLAALDLRRKPDHRAEMTSQLLMGEVVEVLDQGGAGGWWRVRNEFDGYTGWSRSYGIRPASRARTRNWLRLARARVVVPYCQVRSAAKGGHSITPLYWNGHVIAGPRSGSMRKVELPDGRRGFVEAAALDSRGLRVDLIDRIQELLGTPYLWGGKTPLGFDCSGLVQQLLSEQGVVVPRDAHLQYQATRQSLSLAEAGFGDLVFFGRGGARARRIEHVGLMLGGGYFVHARGMVRVNSLESSNPLCDKPLLPLLKGFGRTKLSSRVPAQPTGKRPL